MKGMASKGWNLSLRLLLSRLSHGGLSSVLLTPIKKGAAKEDAPFKTTYICFQWALIPWVFSCAGDAGQGTSLRHPRISTKLRITSEV
jgi:hypothetical protein